METWNRISIIPLPHPSTQIASDTLGSWDFGSLCNNQWFQLQWPTSCQDKHISLKELIPIVLAIMVWCHEWHVSGTHCQYDNQAVVCMLVSGYSWQTNLMDLLRCLFFLEATYRLTNTASTEHPSWWSVSTTLHSSFSLPLMASTSSWILNWTGHHRVGWCCSGLL